MTTALDRIIAYKRDEVAALKGETSMGALLADCKTAPVPRGFAARLTDIAEAGQAALICELKRKSPSAGDILPGADPIAIAQEYEAAGAACLSILTDYPSFGGSLEDLRAIRNEVRLPLLRKEFMIDPIQVAEARAGGADAILVILSAVDDTLAGELLAASAELGMDAIVEVHDEAELDRANALPGTLVGINNRDLKRMVTDLSTTERLAPRLDESKTLISESGISEPAHIQRLAGSGARRFLIGESLMKASDRKRACENLRKALDD
ncbi:MAG: indole-3-glycerol phosphate synthase [Henriciella sp.]|jgi:indole-3-glycerol phosphate synthase|uniref:indole-3-glycerol phosphate synthase TrpC n=1 Tax=Henriciella sp. TaxID=1968823 RepID=UPI000C11986E|nr:indole-3-glycerol phosphate synthase TrpC [Henriciella sp.]MAN75304.1 indole-3-glycerol phosphate synthase [Henriciella sp.]MBF33437.1 indole-3-glycerol phosphate synthase [Hyphomonadaceae bacterium]PHR79856.1 MAG: indole-3-glycerol phosphate synthase [Henriciella sp.]|tara:strand:+ start:14762 stop:15562 length:801 start_codon:yes stop_codon:yes gene_type:complete